jgi:hypothetical protein
MDEKWKKLEIVCQAGSKMKIKHYSPKGDCEIWEENYY